MIGIYQVVNKLNNKSYVGQSVNIKRRFMEHKNLNRDNKSSLTRALKKYGVENFEFNVIHKLNKSELNKLDDLEIYYIKTLKPEYNRDKGGKGSKGHIVSEETKEVLRKKGKEQWNNMTYAEQQKQIKNNLTGRSEDFVLSKESRLKISKTLTGRKATPQSKEKRSKTFQEKKDNGWVKDGSSHFKKVLLIEDNIIFESLKSAGEFLNVHPSNITKHLKGEQKSVKGKTLKLL